MVKRVLTIEPVHATNATEKDGPFADTFIGDRGKVWDIIYQLIYVTDAWPPVNVFRKKCDGRKAMLAFYDHFLGTNNVGHLQKQADMNLQNLTYSG